MKGFFSIEIPTKKYIKAYVISELGAQPMMTTENRIGCKLYDLLSLTNERRTEFANVRYNAQMKIYVNYHVFKNRGVNLNETNIKNFNLFIENEIKARYRMCMDFYMGMFPNFQSNLKKVREVIGIDFEAWDDQSIQKDYYRYRLKTGKDLIYKSNADRIFVPLQNMDLAFD